MPRGMKMDFLFYDPSFLSVCATLCPLGNTVYIRDVSFKHFMHMDLLNMRFWNYAGKICYNSIAYKQIKAKMVLT